MLQNYVTPGHRLDSWQFILKSIFTIVGKKFM